MESRTTRKRIVSKGKYVRAWVAKTLLVLLGIGACLIFVQVTINLLRLFFSVPAGIPLLLVIMVTLFPLAIGLPCGFYSVFRLMKATKQIDPGVPLTRANTADLPAPDSLVRASTEPMQAQEVVLLRAAVQEQVTPPEELVRAVNGQE